jgi:hypothetical protein
MQIAVGEVRGVAQPCGTAVLADELPGDIDEVPYFLEMPIFD